MPRLLLLLGLLGLTPGLALAQLAGQYSGTYTPHGARPMAATMTVKGDGDRVSGQVSVMHFAGAEGLEKTQSTFSFQGKFDKKRNYLIITQLKWMGPAPAGYEGIDFSLPSVIGLNVDLASREMSGDDAIAVAPTGSGRARELLQRQQLLESMDNNTRTPPERRSFATPQVYWTKDYEYVDGTMQPGGWTDLEVSPLDSAHQSLKDMGMKCLTSGDVRFAAGKGSLRERTVGVMTYTLECRGNCKGMTYRALGNGLETHFGLTMPVPTLQRKWSYLGYGEVEWRFTLPASTTTPPQVRVHTWTQDGDTHANGCRFF